MKAFPKLILPLFFISFSASAQQKTVMLDHYFNHEKQVDKQSGKTIDFHYLWDETDLNGFSLFADVFKKNGVKTALLNDAPTLQNLKNASIYIIVDPDSKKENPSPNYIEATHIKAVESWVKAGGTLLLMGNDSANTELKHFNNLMARFGMTFLPELRNHVEGKNWEQGAILIPQNNLILTSARKIYMKDISAIGTKPPAKAVLQKDGFTVIATAKIGKGKVIAIGDPWLYNEYVSGKILSADYQNIEAADDLVKWLIKKP